MRLGERPDPGRGIGPVSVVSKIPKKEWETTYLPAKGLHNNAQGRSRSERTLGKRTGPNPFPPGKGGTKTGSLGAACHPGRCAGASDPGLLLCNPFGVCGWGRHPNPGCARWRERPWALLCNPFGVNSRRRTTVRRGTVPYGCARQYVPRHRLGTREKQAKRISLISSRNPQNTLVSRLCLGTHCREALPRVLVLVLLSVLFCVLNAVKPLQIDDTAYFYFARQLAHHPLDPYGFRLFWYDVPLPANDILAPPLLPYSWALALTVVGDSPALCKLFLLPWSLLLLFSLYALFQRFAKGWEMPLTFFTAFSPALLPSLNFMLDLPALGLYLCALHVFLRLRRGRFQARRPGGSAGGAGHPDEVHRAGRAGVMLLGGLLFGAGG